jgi:DeoR/GlpR family transcriptional regulator of sugar metabolism
MDGCLSISSAKYSRRKSPRETIIMLKSERIQSIKDILLREKQTTVHRLSALLNVSEVTIRSYLQELEDEGFALRVRGGAALNEQQEVINDIVAAINIPYDKEQEHIGGIAAGLIQENENVFIGSGTTCYYIAKALLHRRNITILTNNIYVVNILIANPYVHIIVCGGNLAHAYNCTSGDLFDKSIRNMHFDKSFFTVGGVDPVYGYSVSSEIEAAILKTVKRQTDDLILVIDSSKFGKTSFLHVGDFALSGTVITDQGIDTKYKDVYKEKGIPLYGGK